MKISTKGKYALEIAVDLAVNSDMGHPQSLKNIAGRRNLSVKYLERIIKTLKDGEIVISVRGGTGGYCLAGPPEDITVLDVLQAAEGTLAPVDCLTETGECEMECQVCPTKKVWSDMWQLIQDTADRVTIRQIADKAGGRCL